MKFLQLFALVCAVCGDTTHAQIDSSEGGVEMTAGQDAAYAKLRLRTDIVEQRYCSDGRLRFMLRLKFINEGDKAVILDKRSSVITRYTVSRSFKHAAKNKYEMQVNRLIGMEDAGMSFDISPDDMNFVVIKTGESFSIDEVLSMHNFGQTKGSDSNLPIGNHVLQVTVLTWYYPKVSNVVWRNRWSRKGYLWTDSVTSLPMLLTVEKTQNIEACP